MITLKLISFSFNLVTSPSNNPNRNFEFMNIGYWTPVLGFVTEELAFPHATHFFRNITLDILTVHVSSIQ